MNFRDGFDWLRHNRTALHIWRAFLVLLSVIGLLLGYGLLAAALPAILALGWAFWKVVITGTLIGTEIVLWLHKDKRGLVYWLGVWLVAVSAVEQALPELVGECVQEGWWLLKKYANQRVAGVVRASED